MLIAPTLNYLYRLLACLLVLAFVNSIAIADQTLLPVEVYAATIDGGASVDIPGFLFVTQFQKFTVQYSDNCPSWDPCLNLTRAQVCSALKSSQPKNCSANDWAPAPNLPNGNITWSGNGCGAGIWSTVAGQFYLDVAHSKIYSGDIDDPVADHPSIFFGSACNQHDACYTSPGFQGGCDQKLATSLGNICSNSVDASDCQTLANDYVDAVKLLGGSAYAADQATLQCAEWATAIKVDGCQ